VTRFSILLPTFNSERFVVNAIESTLEQTLAAEAELIVVDDGSCDGTRAIVRQYGDSVRLLEQRNCGTAAARNRALAAAEGEFAVLLDHDDELHPRFLERVGEEFDRDPRLAVVSTDGYCFDARKGKLLSRTYLELWPLPRRLDLVHLIRANYVPPRAAIRVDVLRALGGFDVELSGVDDYDLWLRVLSAGHALSIVSEPLAYYRLRPGSQGSDRLKMAQLAEGSLTKALRELDLDPEAQRECRIRIVAWRERAHLAIAGRALEARVWAQAFASLADASRVSPLRWRGIRVVYFLLEGLFQRRRPAERLGKPVEASQAMRKLPVSQANGIAAFARLSRALRRELGTHARARRFANG